MLAALDQDDDVSPPSDHNLNRPEGRQSLRRGSAALSRSSITGVRCSCGWEFRQPCVTTELAAFGVWCPRCRSTVLLVFRRSQHLASVKLENPTPRELRRSLQAAGIEGDELALLEMIAREMVS